MVDILELTDETLSCRLHPVLCTISELKDIIAEGAKARDGGVPDFLCPYWPEDIAISEVSDPDTKDKMNAWWRGWHHRDYDVFVDDPERVEQAKAIMTLVYDNKDQTDLIAVGERICLTQHQSGLPAEMAFTVFEEQNRFSATDKAMIMHSYLANSLEHKRLSGTSYRRLRQLQEIHRDIVLMVLRTGQFRSVYHMPI